LTDEEYNLKCPAQSYPKCRLLPQFNEEAPEHTSPSRNAERPPRGRDRAVDRPPSGWDKPTTQAEQHPAPPPRKNRDERVRVTRTTSGRHWTVEQDIQDRSTDREDVPRGTTTATYSDVINLTMPGPNAADGLHQSYAAMRPAIEALHTLFAS